MNYPSSFRHVRRFMSRGLRLLAILTLSIIFYIILLASNCFAAKKFHNMRIKNIHIEAEPFINKKEMKWLLNFKPGTIYSDKLIQRGIKTMFLKDFFSDIVVEAEEVDGMVDLTFTLLPKIRINEIGFTGNSEFWNSDLKRSVTIRENDELHEKKIAESIKKLKSFYVKNGFLNVDITYELNKRKDKYDIELLFIIDEGARSKIRSIDIEYPNRAISFDREELLDAMDIAQGDTCSKKNRDKAMSNIIEYFVKNRYYDLGEVRFEYDNVENVDLKLVVDIPYKVKINFNGNDLYSDEKLFSFFDFAKEKTSGTVDKYLNDIMKFYRDNGFYFVKIAVDKKESESDKIKEIINGEKVIDITVFEGPRVKINEIKFTGNLRYKTPRLRKHMLTRNSSFFSNEYLLKNILIDDLKTIKYAYQKNGFLDVKIGKKDELGDLSVYDRVRAGKLKMIVDSAKTPDGKKVLYYLELKYDTATSEVDILIPIDEGKQTVVSDITYRTLKTQVHPRGYIVAKPSYDDIKEEYKEEILRRLKNRVGNPLNIYRLEDEKRVIREVYRRYGYYKVNTDVKSELLPGNKVKLTYIIDEGIKAKIGKRIIAGNDFTKKKVIRREAKLERGDPFVRDDLYLARQRIYRLGYFELVNIHDDISAELDRVKDLVYEVKEKDCGSVIFELGYATEEGVRGSVEVKHTNLGGYGRVASLKADADGNSSGLTFFFEEPWLFNNPYDATISVADRYYQEESYTLREFSTTVGVKKDFFDTIQGILQYVVEFDELRDVEDVAVVIPEDVGTNRICAISPLLVWDSRNDPFNPTSGSFNSFKFDYSSKELGSQLHFQKLTGRSSWYIPLRRNITFALSFRGGYGFSIDAEPELPINKRFFLGGRNTVRGFSADSIGPKGEGDIPIGGSVMVNYNAEFRLSFGKTWGGIIFYDAGNVWSDNSDFDPVEVRDAAGVGIRFLTMAGPLSLDIGQKLDRQPGEALTEWYFTIGNIF